MTENSYSEEIKRLKKETGTLVLAHTYQKPEIIAASDITGDSFALADACLKTEAKRVIMCGVRFMAESIKILSPEKEVILPAPQASCPMAEMISPERVREYKKNNPESLVVAYINTSAALKAECDVCVTSSSALKIIEKLDAPEILFIPDKNLGAYVKARFPEKNILLWEGCCPVHNIITTDDIREAVKNYPDAVLAVHPECTPEVAAMADFVGSTSEIISFAEKSDRRVIIGTERGVADRLRLTKDGDKYIYLRPDKLVCPDMKYTDECMLINTLKGECGEKIELDEEIRIKAKKSIDKMLELG